MKLRTLLKRTLMIALIITLILTVPTLAASKKKKALKTYGKYLSKSAITVKNYGKKTRVKPEQFAVIKLNGDKVPELITLSNSQLFFFCYKKGKIRQIGNAGLFTSGVKYFPGRQLLKNSSFGGVGVSSENYIQINVKKQKTADCCMAISGMNFKEYYIQGRQVSRSSYSSYVKKLVGSVREKEIRFIQNTKKNRKRYLK